MPAFTNVKLEAHSRLLLQTVVVEDASTSPDQMTQLDTHRVAYQLGDLVEVSIHMPGTGYDGTARDDEVIATHCRRGGQEEGR